jgi:hypothetical protein
MSRLFDDASLDYLEDSNAILTAAPFTWSIWFRADDDTDNFLVLGTLTQGGVDEHFFRWRIRIVDGQINWRVEESGSVGQVITTAGPSINVWHHAVAVEAASNDRRIYLDGSNKGTDTSTVVPTGINTTSIGRLDDGTPGDNFSGDLAHAAVWNVALTDQEVATLAAGVSPLRVRRDSLVGYWPINGQSPEYNVMGTGINLTVNGTTISEEPPIPHSIVAP